MLEWIYIYIYKIIEDISRYFDKKWRFRIYEFIIDAINENVRIKRESKL